MSLWAARMAAAAALMALPLAALASHPGEPGAGPVLPKDVRAYLERREACEHWRGEEGYDAARRREIEAAVCETCPNLLSTWVRLMRTYEARPEVREALFDQRDDREIITAGREAELCRKPAKTRGKPATGQHG